MYIKTAANSHIEKLFSMPPLSEILDNRCIQNFNANRKHILLTQFIERFEKKKPHKLILCRFLFIYLYMYIPLEQAQITTV